MTSTPPPGPWPPQDDWAERARRQRALADRLAAQQRLDEARQQAAWQPEIPSKRTRRRRRRRRSGNRFIAVLAVVALVGAGLTAEQWTTAGSEGLALVGAGTVFGERTTQSNRPSPREDVGSTPLGSPAPGGPSGSHAFVAMRPDANAPVAYDPCRTIRYVINSAHAPPGAEAMVTESLAAVTAATGLVFEPVGATDEAPSVERDAFQPDRYGDTWAPVVIGWTTPEEEPALAGAVAGQGGSAWLQIDNVEVDGRRVSSTAAFVTGVIALDGPQIGRIANERPDGYAAARAVVMHEVGHLVGLQHVADPTQLMNPENSVGITEFQAGDLEGLRALGNGPCIPEL